MNNMIRTAIFPGTFDPFTKGHEDIVLRGLKMFDKVIIGIGVNAQKTRLFDQQFMLESIRKTFEAYPQVEVKEYSGLTAHFAQKEGTKFILRGLRNTTDFEYENAISQGNKHLNSELETVFLITSPMYAYISSTTVRDIHRYGGEVSDFLPYKLD